MKILVIDNRKAMRMVVKKTLRKAGVDEGNIAEARNGREGLAMIHASHPDIVFSDWNTPEITGIELLEIVREAGNDIEFGFVTSGTTDAMRERANEAGGAFFITKPFTEQTFERALASLNH